MARDWLSQPLGNAASGGGCSASARARSRGTIAGPSHAAAVSCLIFVPTRKQSLTRDTFMRISTKINKPQEDCHETLFHPVRVQPGNSHRDQ